VTSPAPTPDPVGSTQIAELLAWARALTEAGPATDPAQRVAYLAAKTALLARITGQHPDSVSTKDTL
jgi:hypothetical protein